MARRRNIAHAAVLGGALTAATAAWGAPGASPAAAMPKPMKAWLYRDPGFAGPSMTVDATQLFMETPWPVRSMRIAGDGKWQMCSDSLFEGTCVTISNDSTDLSTDHRWSLRIGSARAICSKPGQN